MPVGSPAREKWNAMGLYYVRKAGLLYGLGLRQLLLIAPLIAHMLHPLGGASGCNGCVGLAVVI